MNDDFNPFDLSAVPQAATEQKPVAPAPPKPIIRRISMGPIFHSRITKVLAAILSVVLAVLIGYTATSYYLTRESSASNNATGQTITKTTEDSTNLSTSQSTATANPSAQTATDAAANTPNTTTSTNTNSGSTGNTSSGTIYCGVAGMPEGVCTAITSIEKDGLRSNPYVNADTSQVPAGSTVQVTESSWKATNETSGTVNFTANLGGTNYSGIATLNIIDNVWKVTSYTLQQ